MLLNFLRIEGFMPDDTKEKWHEVVTELRDSADAILGSSTVFCGLPTECEVDSLST